MTPSLEPHLNDRLMACGATLATAESCTGGLIAHQITNASGSSAYYMGGVVTYSNDAKVQMLGVLPETLEEHGAVSEAVARQMAEGVCRLFGTRYGIGVTGIAGPAGGTPEKPVGLVYLGVRGPAGCQVSREVFEGGRVTIKEKTAAWALNVLDRVLQEGND